MATQTIAEAAREAVKGRLSPALEALEENIRQLRRAVKYGRFTAEDFAAGAALQVRRHPLGAVAAGVCAGLAVGALAGFFVARNDRART